MAATIGTLGCAQQYTVLLASKDGIPVGDLTAGGNFANSVEWSRRLDDFSEATVTIPLNADCCGLIADAHVWHTELQIFRDGVYVWSGPLVNIKATRTEATLYARDLIALLDKRIIHVPTCFALACAGFGYAGPEVASDLSDLGAFLIADGLIVDGHNFTIDATPTGILGERLYRLGQDNTSLNALQEVMQLGLDVTMLGRKFVLGNANGGAPFGTSATLTCDDFLGSPQFEEDGLNLATRAIVLGDNGIIGLAKAPDTDVNGKDAYYGLLELIDLNRGELNTQAIADQAAASIILSHYPAPTNLVTPNNVQLSINAPITIAELVPGTFTPIIIDCLCRPVSAVMVLIEVNVIWDTDGEHVSVTYASLGSQNSGELGQ